MKLKALLIGATLPFTSLACSGDLLQEFVKIAGTRLPDPKNLGSYYIAYSPILRDNIDGKPMIETILYRNASLENTVDYFEKNVQTEIIIYGSNSQDGDRLRVIDNNSNGIYEPGDLIVFEGKNKNLWNWATTIAQMQEIMTAAYNLAEDYYGLIRFDLGRNYKPFTSTKKPIHS